MAPPIPTPSTVTNPTHPTAISVERPCQIDEIDPDTLLEEFKNNQSSSYYQNNVFLKAMYDKVSLACQKNNNAGNFNTEIKYVFINEKIKDAIRDVAQKYRDDGFFNTKIIISKDSKISRGNSGDRRIILNVIEGHITRVVLNKDLRGSEKNSDDINRGRFLNNDDIINYDKLLIQEYSENNDRNMTLSAEIFRNCLWLQSRKTEDVSSDGRGRPLRLDDIENCVGMIQSLPGVTVRPILKAADNERKNGQDNQRSVQPGDSELEVFLDQRPVSGYMIFDTYGSEYMGPFEFLVGAGYNFASGPVDRIEGLFFNTLGDQQWYTQFSAQRAWFVGDFFGIPLMNWGRPVIGKVFAGYGESRPGDFLDELGYYGSSYSFGVAATIPAWISRRWGLSFTPQVDYSHSNIDVYESVDSRRRVPQSLSSTFVTRFTTAIDFCSQCFGYSNINYFLLPIFLGNNHTSVTLHQGWPWFGTTKPSNELIPRPDATARFFKVTADWDKSVTIPDLDPQLRLTINAKGQWSKNTLVPSEKFYIGGTLIGRGYYNGEITGDSGFGIHSEISYYIEDSYRDLPPLYHKPYIFYGYGKVYDNNSDGTEIKNVQSIGAGYQVSFDFDSDYYKSDWNFPNFYGNRPLFKSVSLGIEYVHRLTRQPNGANETTKRPNIVFGRLDLRF